MNHFDVETYAKEMLDDLKISPKEESWSTISGELKSIAYKNRKRKKIRSGLVVCLLLLISHFQLNLLQDHQDFLSLTTLEKKWDVDEIPKVEIHKKIASSDIVLNDKTQKNKNAKKVNLKIVIPKVKLSSPKTENELLWEKFQGNSKHFDDLEKKNQALVLKEETDSLLGLAEQHLQQQEQLIIEENRKTLAFEILSDLDKENTTKKENRFLKNVKNNYTKFKRIIAN